MTNDKQRERLVELLRALNTAPEVACPRYHTDKDCKGCQFDKGDRCDVAGREAAYLLANGVIVPPCKVGDVVYSVFEDDVIEDEIILIEVTESAIYLSTCTERYMWVNGYLYSEMLDQKLYITREEAEQALRKEDEGK